MLAFILMSLALVLCLSLASASMVIYHMKSGNAFYRIIKDTHLCLENSRALLPSSSLLGAPEGWDHLNFYTEMSERAFAEGSSYSWRVAAREQFRDIALDVMLESSRPHILVIIDDSTAMNTSSGRDYRDESLYLKRPTGEVVLVSEVSEIPDRLVRPEGIYFTGQWGNSHQISPDAPGLHGAMSSWAFAFSSVMALLDSIDLCEVAVMSTSKGLIEPFTHRAPVLIGALQGVHPDSAEARLSQALYQATGLFPEHCDTNRHIIVVSAGVSINDGDLPDWLKDYDKDGNPNDTFISGPGSHCLDDVSSYARSLGIKVHVMGPDTAYLRDVAAKGSGLYMPGREAFVPAQAFYCQPIVPQQGRDLKPEHSLARLDPSWLGTKACRCFRPGVKNPLDLVSCPDLPIKGTACSLAVSGSTLCYTTSQDRLLVISLCSNELSWMVNGVGGIVKIIKDRIIAGPNRGGIITVLDPKPSILWLHNGQLFDASDCLVFLSDGFLLTAHDLEGGERLNSYDTNHTITVIRYDPCEQLVLAGTMDGLIYLFTQRLEPAGIVDTGLGEAVTEIRPFTWRKRLHLAVIGRSRVATCTTGGPLWSASLEGASPACCTIMDNKVYVSTFHPGPLGGIDAGASRLLVFDAITGKPVSTSALCAGRAFGPALDLERGKMKFISFNGTIYEEDISGLPGITSCPLGTRLIRSPE